MIEVSTQVPPKDLGKVIPVHLRKKGRTQGKSAISYDDSDGSALAVFTPGASDAQLVLSRNQVVAEPVPLTSDPTMQAAIIGLLKILQTIDRYTLDRAVTASLRRRLHQLLGSWYLCNVSTARHGLEQFHRDDLTNVLQGTLDQLNRLDRRLLRYRSFAQVISKCSIELDNYLAKYAFAAQLQMENDMSETHEMVQQFRGPAAIELPRIVTLPSCMTLVDAAGNEHKIPLEYSTVTSFQKLQKMLEYLFMEQGQHSLCIDEGTQVTELTSTRDECPKLEAETKTLMEYSELLCELPEDLSQLLRKISQDAVAQGGFCDVWKCSLTYTSGITLKSKTIDVAVKVLRILPHDEAGKKDIQREMGIWRRLQHSHIVPFFGVAHNFAPSRISLVSSWQENGTLTSLLERNRDMSYKDRLFLLHDIANGLSYLHSVKVVHGDLTGSNVLIDADGRARLTDFGLSSVVDAGEGLTYLALTTRRPGAIRWVAPELIIEEDHILPTSCSDIYSYGCVMLQTLSGRLPWSEIKNERAIIVKLSRGCLPQRPESLPILNTHWDFIMLCLNPSVESRPSATEVLKWIDDALSSCVA